MEEVNKCQWNDWENWDVIEDIKKVFGPEIDPKTGLPKEDAARMIRLEKWLEIYTEILSA